jgi:hypothetical protein
MDTLKVCRQTILRDADNLAVWVYFDTKTDVVSRDSKLSLLDSEIQEICKEFISTIDESSVQPKARPNPTPRVFIEQGNDLSRVLWLSWES